MHMLPRSDPLEQSQFGGTQKELEIIAGYQDALKKLQKPKTFQGTDEDAGKGKGGGAKKKEDRKGGGKGGGNDGLGT